MLSLDLEGPKTEVEKAIVALKQLKKQGLIR